VVVKTRQERQQPGAAGTRVLHVQHPRKWSANVSRTRPQGSRRKLLYAKKLGITAGRIRRRDGGDRWMRAARARQTVGLRNAERRKRGSEGARGEASLRLSMGMNRPYRRSYGGLSMVSCWPPAALPFGRPWRRVIAIEGASSAACARRRPKAAKKTAGRTDRIRNQTATS
jgi:hypothetical protein